MANPRLSTYYPNLLTNNLSYLQKFSPTTAGRFSSMGEVS